MKSSFKVTPLIIGAIAGFFSQSIYASNHLYIVMNLNGFDNQGYHLQISGNIKNPVLDSGLDWGYDRPIESNKKCEDNSKAPCDLEYAIINIQDYDGQPICTYMYNYLDNNGKFSINNTVVIHRNSPPVTCYAQNAGPRLFLFLKYKTSLR